MTNLDVLDMHFQELKARAEERFNVDLGEVYLVSKLKGISTLGMAHSNEKGMYIDINVGLVAHYLNDCVELVLPHELAHIIQYARGHSGGHGADWKEYCALLGGDSQRVSKKSYPLLKPAKKMRQWKYACTLGETHVLSTVRHNKLQKNKITCYNVRGGGSIYATGFIGEIND